jgi:Uma2 family endonuclease
MSDAAEVLPLNFSAFLEWEHAQPDRHEFLHGEIVGMVGTTDQHNKIAGNFYMLLRHHLKGRPCEVYMSDVMLRAETADAAFYPDLMVTCAETDREDRYVKRDPVLVVEVLSESTAAYDLGEKFAAYRQLPGLKEYVLVDPQRPRIQIFRPGADGHWVLYPAGPEDRLELTSVGLNTSVGELYGE